VNTIIIDMLCGALLLLAVTKAVGDIHEVLRSKQLDVSSDEDDEPRRLRWHDDKAKVMLWLGGYWLVAAGLAAIMAVVTF